MVFFLLSFLNKFFTFLSLINDCNHGKYVAYQPKYKIYNLGKQQKQPRMENINRNGSYVERRKMYIEFPLHNMKSKIPIDWSIDELTSQERNRIISKQQTQREKIKRMYDQKMERKIQERYNSGLDNYKVLSAQSLDSRDKDSLAQQVQSYNTSKIMTNSIVKNNPQNHEQKSQQILSSSKGLQAEYMHRPESKNRQNERNQRDEQYSNDRRRYYDQRSYEKQRRVSQRQLMDRDDRYDKVPRYNYDSQRNENNQYQSKRYYEDSQNRYNQRQQRVNRQEQRFSPYRQKSLPYESQPYLPRDNNYRPQYYMQPSYKDYKDPYFPHQQNYRNLSKQHRKSLEDPNHPFRNAMPDRLQQFLRERSKADRKSVIKVQLSDKPKNF